MQKKRMRFGDFIKHKRLSDPRELRQADVADALDISVGYLSDIERRQRNPFDPEKIEKFVEFFSLSEEDKARIYDLASHENREVPSDIEDVLMYEEVGDMARFALRQFKAGNLEEEDWKQLIRKAEENKARRERSEAE